MTCSPAQSVYNPTSDLTCAAVHHTTAHGTLPFTGLDLAVIVLIAALLVLSGIVLRRMTA